MRRAALVTGSARGIGRGIALRLAADGFDVAIHYRRSQAEAEQAALEAEALGVRTLLVAGDLTDRARAGDVVDEAAAGLGGLGVLVNNVGNYVFRPLEELTDAEWDDMFASNLDATFATSRAALPHLRRGGGGRIVNLGYAGAQNLVARPSIVAYGIAKTGVTLLTKAIARVEAPHGITANVVAPGVIENSLTQPRAELPAGRTGTIAEVAAAVAYLVSPEAEYVTGQVIEVSGGWNL